MNPLTTTAAADSRRNGHYARRPAYLTRLHLARYVKGVSREEMAQALGVSYSAWSQVEAGNTPVVDADHREVVASFFAVDPAWLWEDGGFAHETDGTEVVA